MSVIALQVSKRRSHPNADHLFIYDFTGPDHQTVQIVGNNDNVYQPGEVVAVALTGAVLADGTRIRPVLLRGVASEGMALGRVDHAPGADLSPMYCTDTAASASPVEPTHVKWTSVELLHNVRRGIEVRREDALAVGDTYPYPIVTYRAKVKLDGTNGGVQLLGDGRVLAQSRSRLITTQDDNLGFAAWVDENRVYFQRLDTGGEHVIIYGEWCGQGIQKRTSISKIDRKVFAVFALQFGDHNQALAKLEIEPERIRAFLPEHPDVHVLPWYGPAVTLDYGDREALEQAVVTINQMVADVEACDPWVADAFGVQGLGEGLVMYPQRGADSSENPEKSQDSRVFREAYVGLMFKAKGEKHQVVKQKKPAQLGAEVAADVAQFVELFVTPQRLEQAVAEGCGGVYAMQQMGVFMKWIGQDIKKESEAELEASGLEWKHVSKEVMNAARKWYKEAIERL